MGGRVHLEDLDVDGRMRSYMTNTRPETKKRVKGLSLDETTRALCNLIKGGTLI